MENTADLRLASLLWASLALCSGACAYRNEAVNAPDRTPEELQADVEIANAFAGDERSSHNVDAMLRSCLDDLPDYTSRVLVEQHSRTWFCVCLTDAFGVSHNHNVSYKEAGRQCLDFAQQTTVGTTSDTRTPFTGPSALTSRQISNAQQSCLETAKHDTNTAVFLPMQQAVYCSCLTDSMRARRTADSTTPAEVVSRCSERAAGARW